MLFRFSVCLFVLAFLIILPTAETFAQESLDKYAYRTNTKNIFRIHDNKKLNKDEILELMVDDQIAQDKFKKSLKLRKAVWVTGIAWVGSVAYLATQEELRENSWSDYDSGQKGFFVGFVTLSTVFCGAMIGEFHYRAKSFSLLDLCSRAEELGYLDKEQEYLSLDYSGAGLSLSYHF